MVRGFFTFVFLLLVAMAKGQAKKPTIMILPGDNWCIQRYFVTEFNNQGTIQKVPNYKQAFQEDAELGLVISKIGSLMIDRGFPLKDAEQEIKNLEVRSMESNMTQSVASGSSISESPLDKLLNRVRSDLVLQIWWEVRKVENGRLVSFTLDALDSYTGKKIASSTGVGTPNKTDIVPVLLLNSIASHIDPFVSQLQGYFDDMMANGREIRISVRKWDNWDKNLETVVNGDEIRNHIYDWMQSHTANGRFTELSSSENQVEFEQVRIPIYDDRNRALDARQFAVGLQKHLKAAPFGFDVKVLGKGLGEAVLILGEK